MKTFIENALNRYLALDPESHQRILQLQGKVVTMELLGIALTFQLVFVEGAIQLRWQDFLPADMTIRGTPLNLLHMSLARAERQRFFADDVSVEGNLELARLVLAIFDELEIDWEEITSRYLGDVSAHQVGRFVRGVKKFGSQLRQALMQNVNEYVHEEVNLFPPDEMLRDFFNQVDEFRMDVDRLEARLLRLSRLREVRD